MNAKNRDLARLLLTGKNKNSKKIKIILYKITRMTYIKNTTKDNTHRPSARLGECLTIKEGGAGCQTNNQSIIFLTTNHHHHYAYKNTKSWRSSSLQIPTNPHRYPIPRHSSQWVQGNYHWSRRSPRGLGWLCRTGDWYVQTGTHRFPERQGVARPCVQKTSRLCEAVRCNLNEP